MQTSAHYLHVQRVCTEFNKFLEKINCPLRVVDSGVPMNSPRQSCLNDHIYIHYIYYRQQISRWEFPIAVYFDACPPEICEHTWKYTRICTRKQ